MKLAFKKAERRNTKLRMFVYGLSGSGKTYLSLLIAASLGKKIAVIDTEVGHAQFFANFPQLPEFDIIEIPDTKIETFDFYIKKAISDGYDVLIIDSITHEWDYIKEIAEAGANFSKNGKKDLRSGWGTATPIHKKFLRTLMTAQLHIIATGRAKVETVLEEYTDRSGNRKQQSVKITGAPEQKSGIESDFTLSLKLEKEQDDDKNITYLVTIERSRLDKATINNKTIDFPNLRNGAVIRNPGKEFAEEISSALNPLPEEKTFKAIAQQINRLQELIEILKISTTSVQEGLKMKNVSSLEELTEDQAKRWIASLEERVKMLKTKPQPQNDVTSEDI